MRVALADEQLLELYRRCAGGVYRLALSITLAPDVAEDVVQEAFCRVQERLGQLGEREALDGYLFRTARNLACDRLRGLARAPGELSEVALVQSPAAAAEAVEEAARVSRALGELPQEQREVVVLRVYEGFSFPRIAELTDVPLGTVHSRFRYALERLRRSLEVAGD